MLTEANPRLSDPELVKLLSKLAEMRRRHEHIQGELAELEDMVRRYQVSENAPPAPPGQLHDAPLA
jgi:hypothetical protein